MGRYLNKKLITWLLRCFLVAAIMCLQWIQLEASPGEVKTWTFLQAWQRILMNRSWIVLVNLILVLVVQRWEIVLSITSVLCGLWSVAGYYVTMYHGSPLCFTMLRSIGTARKLRIPHYRLCARIGGPVRDPGGAFGRFVPAQHRTGLFLETAWSPIGGFGGKRSGDVCDHV